MKTANAVGMRLFVWIIFASLALSACANKDDNNNRATGRAAKSNAVNQEIAATSVCSDTKMEWGKIYEANSPMNLEAQVKGFVSATLDPAAIGAMDGQLNSPTGVDVYGSFYFDQAGNLIADKSKLKIKIVDEFVGQIFEGKAIEPYFVEFNAASEGHLNRSTGTLQVTFQDSYGSITFRGVHNGTHVSGTVEYANTVAVAGLSPASGKLGDFISYSCSMIK